MIPYDADNWQEVESANIAAVGTRGHYLIVLFNKGAAYRYAHAADEFGALINAESVGKYFAQAIKGPYECERLPSEEAGWPDDDDV